MEGLSDFFDPQKEEETVRGSNPRRDELIKIAKLTDGEMTRVEEGGEMTDPQPQTSDSEEEGANTTSEESNN